MPDYEIKLDIKEDYMFKKVFGDRDDNPILISFLNAVLNNKPLIKRVKMLNSELVRDLPDTKTVILDIQAQTKDGTYIDIELQRSYASDLLNRFLLYSAKQLCKHTSKGKNAPPLDVAPKIISIWILDCKVKGLEEFDDALPTGNLCYTSDIDITKRVVTPNFSIIPIELHKIRKYKNITPELVSWLKFFEESKEIKSPVEVKAIKEAYDKMKGIGGNKAYINYLEAREKYDRNKNSEIITAREEGLAEGLEKGKEEGLAEGVEKGKEEGEHNAKIETAKNLLSMGLSVEQISKATGLSIKDINALQ